MYAVIVNMSTPETTDGWTAFGPYFSERTAKVIQDAILSASEAGDICVVQLLVAPLVMRSWYNDGHTIQKIDADSVVAYLKGVSA